MDAGKGKSYMRCNTEISMMHHEKERQKKKGLAGEMKSKVEDEDMKEKRGGMKRNPKLLSS